jgi:hypothetical protein
MRRRLSREWFLLQAAGGGVEEKGVWGGGKEGSLKV